jgi:CRISPR-associated protein Cas5d
MNAYPVTLEIAGPMAMFARPDTGGTPTSYPVPTWSAAKAILESIAFFSDGEAWFNPTRVEVCCPIGRPTDRLRYQRYTTNYGGPLRKPSLFAKGVAAGGSSMQFFSTVLIDVCYRLYADIVGPKARAGNPRHHLQSLFSRRILWRGENEPAGCYRTPVLGWSECVCRYWGPPRCRMIAGDNGLVENVAWKKYCQRWEQPFVDLTEVAAGLSLVIPSMLVQMWDQPTSGSSAPTYAQELKLINGVFEYPQLATPR